MREFAFLVVLTAAVSACGSPLEEKYQEGYENGYEEGLEAGKRQAIDCVRDEGGGAEDAADNCE
jgi:hypothetical protein